MDPAGIEHRQVVDEVNSFCREQCLPSELSVKLRSYFRDLNHLVRSRRHTALLKQMPADALHGIQGVAGFSATTAGDAAAEAADPDLGDYRT